MININSFLWAYLGIYLFSSLCEIGIDLLNRSYLRKRGQSVPEGFEGMIDNKKLIDMNSYTIDQSRLTMVKTIVSKIFLLAIILSGVLPWISERLNNYNQIISGLIFFAILGLAGFILDLPFGYYHIFRLEERYGFNTQTIKSWILDILKSMVLAVILGGILLSLLLLMVVYAGDLWWIWAWLIFLAFQLLMTIIYPTVIAPIFNKFIPVENEALAEKIQNMSETAKLKVKGIFQMDAGRRSRHTNAYFTGLGKTKRIVLYDTLLDSHEDDEILAVLAHEIGHLKKGHIKKQVVVMGISSLILLFLASKMLTWNLMFGSFGFIGMPVYAGLFLISIIWDPIGFFLSPLTMALSRRFEREADRYTHRSFSLAKPLVSALKRMALDNLANLCPHPIYVQFHYSHPPILERIKTLEEISAGGSS